MLRFSRFAFWPAVCGLLVAVLIIERLPEKDLQATPSIPLVSTTRAAPAQPMGPVSYAKGTEAAAPSVVNIYTTRVVSQPVHPLLMDPFFRQFFGYSQMPRQRRMENSLGSGVVVSADGYVLTNHHVIQGADEIRVALRDGRETNAELVGSDPDTDLALLRIQMDRVPAIRIRDSDEMQVGDVVLAIGNPFGVGQTVTMGIISATRRSSLGINTFEDFIQTDAAINPGNSGGALVDAHGRLIGINTAIFSRSGGNMGIGFAIPSNLAREVMGDLITHGRVIRGWLGIEIQELTPQLAESFGMSRPRGIVIAGIFRDGPAHRAGVAPGDVLLQINGEAVENGRQAMDRIARIRPGQKARLRVLRDGRELEMDAEVGTRDRRNMVRQR